MAAYFLHAINIPWHIWWRHPNGNPPKTDNPRGTKEALVAKEEATGNQLPERRRLHLTVVPEVGPICETQWSNEKKGPCLHEVKGGDDRDYDKPI